MIGISRRARRGARGGQARPDRKALRPAARSARRADRAGREKNVLARVVYHKLADPDHKKLRTHVQDGVLRHVNNGYCSLLEPKSISRAAVRRVDHGAKPGHLCRGPLHQADRLHVRPGRRPPGSWPASRATGQRGLVGPADGPTWDSVQMQMVYAYPDGREAAFDIHTSWVTPDNFPGYVEQEVQFRFDNGVWAAHQRKRGVEVTVENRSPGELKYTPNHHYNGKFLEPWDERSQRGYGIEIISGSSPRSPRSNSAAPPNGRGQRLAAVRAMPYADLAADRNTVAAVQALEAILARHAAGQPGCVVRVNDPAGGLVLLAPGVATPEVLVSGVRVRDDSAMRMTPVDDKRLIRVSKFLSRHLRHAPEDLGLTLEAGGWVRVDDLLAGCRRGRHADRPAPYCDRSSRTTTSSDSPSTRPANASAPTRAIRSRSISNSAAQTRPISCTTAPRRPRLAAILAIGLLRDGPPPRPPLGCGSDTAERSARGTAGRSSSSSMRRRCTATATRSICSANGVWLVDAVPPRYLRAAVSLAPPEEIRHGPLPCTTPTSRPRTPSATTSAQVEPRSLRTWTPTQAVLARAPASSTGRPRGDGCTTSPPASSWPTSATTRARG